MSYLPAYDANGNVTEYVAASDGAVPAHYDYSPFGGIVLQTGSLAGSFTHRFSTKPWCAVTGLYEYQFRKYSPELGRWMSRDPIGEKNSNVPNDTHEDFLVEETSGRMVPSLDCCPSTNEKMHPCNLNGNAAAVTKSDEIHLCCKGVNNPAPYGGLDCIVIHEMLHKIIHSTHEQEMTGENLQNERLVVRISTLFMGKQCPVPAYSETGQ